MKQKRPFAQVLRVAEQTVERLGRFCDRIEIAGSLRRQCAQVGDIEIIAVPTSARNLFGTPTSDPSALDVHLDALIGMGKIRHVERQRWGSRQKSFMFDTGQGTYQVDLFLQPDPQTWGVNMMLRTGSAGFNSMMVRQRYKGGWCPDDLRFDKARIWRNGTALSTPTERDVFNVLGLEWIEPQDREVIA